VILDITVGVIPDFFEIQAAETRIGKKQMKIIGQSDDPITPMFR